MDKKGSSEIGGIVGQVVKALGSLLLLLFTAKKGKDMYDNRKK